MNEYVRFSIAAFVLMVLAGLIVMKTVPWDPLLPAIEAKPGVIYAIKSGATPATVTGYVIAAGDREERIPEPEEKLKPVVPAVMQVKAPEKIVKAVHQAEVVGRKVSPAVEELNLYMIENIVAKSDKSYTLNKSKEINGILVELLTLTPYRGDQILKFRVTNRTDKYFIPQSAGFSEVQSKLLFRQVINSQEKAEGYLIFSGKGFPPAFSLIESGGRYRKFSIIMN